MAPVGLPSAAGMPPQEAHVPTAITAAARGARRSSHSRLVIWRPVPCSSPRPIQKPSPESRSSITEPSQQRTNGASSSPSAAMRRFSTHSAPDSTDTTQCTSSTLGSPGMMPAIRSSSLGCVAPVTATEQPSHDAPTIHSRYTFSSGPMSSTSVRGSTRRLRMPMGENGSCGSVLIRLTGISSANAGSATVYCAIVGPFPVIVTGPAGGGVAGPSSLLDAKCRVHVVCDRRHEDAGAPAEEDRT